MVTRKKFILAISREFGTGGRSIARAVAAKLDVKLLDRNYLNIIHEQFNLTAAEIEEIKAKKSNWWDDVCKFYNTHDYVETYNGKLEKRKGKVTSAEIYHAETQILKDFTDHESCVIVGRSACHIYKDDPTAVKVFLYASIPARMKRVVEKYGVDEKTAKKMIEENDKSRENYSKTFSGKTRYDLRDYDMTIKIDNMTQDQCVDMLVDFVLSKQ